MRCHRLKEQEGGTGKSFKQQRNAQNSLRVIDRQFEPRKEEAKIFVFPSILLLPYIKHTLSYDLSLLNPPSMNRVILFPGCMDTSLGRKANLCIPSLLLFSGNESCFQWKCSNGFHGQKNYCPVHGRGK